MSKTELGIDDHDPSESARATRRRCDWTSVTPSTAVAELVADVASRDMTEIAPLYDTVDSDALDSLVRHHDDSDDCRVSFVHDGFSITVSADGEVLVTVREDDR